MDGIWEAPTIDNPLCKTVPGCGKWTPPMVSNPAYKVPWSAPLIDNPNYQVCQSIFFF
jgi:calnexin